MSSTYRWAVSSSRLIVLASPDSTWGGLGRARVVSLRGVLFLYCCHFLLCFVPGPLDGTASSVTKIFVSQRVCDIFSLLTPDLRVWLCHRAHFDVSTPPTNLQDKRRDPPAAGMYCASIGGSAGISIFASTLFSLEYQHVYVLPGVSYLCTKYVLQYFVLLRCFFVFSTDVLVGATGDWLLHARAAVLIVPQVSVQHPRLYEL